jgi:hypothetical protein
MTNFENLRSMSVEQLAEWLDKHGQFDTAPWTTWFDRKYCNNCEAVMCKYEDGEREFPCAYCEIHDVCKFFPEFNYVPGHEDVVKMWLESEVQDGGIL